MNDWAGVAKLVMGGILLAGLVYLAVNSKSGEIAKREDQRDDAQGRAIESAAESEYQRKVAAEEKRVAQNADRHDRGPVDADRIGRMLGGDDPDQGGQAA